MSADHRRVEKIRDKRRADIPSDFWRDWNKQVTSPHVLAPLQGPTSVPVSVSACTFFLSHHVKSDSYKSRVDILSSRENSDD